MGSETASSVTIHEPNLNLANIHAHVQEHVRSYPTGKLYEYGTAGFRMNHKHINSVAYRMGALATIRSYSTGDIAPDHFNPQKKYYRPIGVMITASHNGHEDNGLKIVDSNGGMMCQKWEPYSTHLANVPEDQVLDTIRDIAVKNGLPILPFCFDVENQSIPSHTPVVFVGYDTRTSSPELAKLVCQAVVDFGGKCVNFGVLTTPQFHYMTGLSNDIFTRDQKFIIPHISEYNRIFDAFDEYITLIDQNSNNSEKSQTSLNIDCALGVGAFSCNTFKQHILRTNTPFSIELLNNPYNDENILVNTNVNHLCGAEFVKKNCKSPNSLTTVDPNTHYISVDGDCDRVVYYVPQSSEDGTPRPCSIIDGDRISILLATHIRNLLKIADINGLSLGIVQTPYANGSSTRHAKKLGLNIALAHTGVKHLHLVAQTTYDIGVYFEANGHGTALFSHKALETIHAALPPTDNDNMNDNTVEKTTPIFKSPKTMAIQELILLSRMINPYIGDALSDILATEVILRKLNWSISEWTSQYSDIPNVMDKLVVPDRNMIVVSKIREDICDQPVGLQDAINVVVNDANAVDENNGIVRAFVRPSGTEDIVRIYVEAKTEEQAQTICNEIKEVVLKHLV